jgi:hypothetical protein
VKPLLQALFWFAVSALVYRGVTRVLHPKPDLPWIWPYGILLLAGLSIFGAIQSYWKTGTLFPARSVATPEALTRPERILSKAAGSFLILAGLIVLGIGGWLAWDQYDSVAQGRRTKVLLSRLGVSSSEPERYSKFVKAEEGVALFALIFVSGGVWVYRRPRLLR